MKKRLLLLLVSLTATSFIGFAVNGYDLWLGTGKQSHSITISSSMATPTINIAKQELINGWEGASGKKIRFELINDPSIKEDGFRISSTCIQAKTDIGILYGVYDYLRKVKTGCSMDESVSNPSYRYRILNHWDNLDGSIERGYAGKSIFWRGVDHLEVTEEDRERWRDYARANASIGINGTVLNNVNATPEMLRHDVLSRAGAIADVLRPYGIRIFLSINFSSPAQLGHLNTSDPLNKEVIKWWHDKVKEIYALIPDFGGFLVKANSEGLPGPQDYGRTHADGANLLADALKPYNGVVMWRAFVYQANDRDRAKQAYTEFMPLDGQFRENVMIQVKNGPVDFQPREPFSPLFGAMKKTSVMPELQITQEYLGHSEQLVFLAPLWEECLQSDTYQEGPGSTVACCSNGSIYRFPYTAIAGVANIGMDSDWCGHIFAQANWYAFGRLAWNCQLKSEQIADEWLRLTFIPELYTKRIITATEWYSSFLRPVAQMMLQSREAAVKYMMPLGLHHLFAGNHHYGPGPWYAPKGLRADWTPPYYHKADTVGIGFDRSMNGTQAVAQYHEPLCSLFNNPSTCPDQFILWFHHLPWNYIMKNGKTLWNELCYQYEEGVQTVRHFQQVWDQVEPYVDKERFYAVQTKLKRQARDAQVWKDACLLYFQQFSCLPVPYDIERPVYRLDYLMKIDMLRINEESQVGNNGNPSLRRE